jgi:DnaK suppressor protein
MPAIRKKVKEKTSATAVATSMPVMGIKPYALKKGEKYMNKKMLGHFRLVLNAWKTELEEEITRTVHSLRDEPENPADPNDRASQETDMSLELRSRDRERKLIKKIDEAIERIDTGEYGYCDNCGVEIGVERLEARPTAELCIDCKTLDEIRERKMGSEE